MNEWYAKNISKKIRSAYKTKALFNIIKYNESQIETRFICKRKSIKYSAIINLFLLEIQMSFFLIVLV